MLVPWVGGGGAWLSPPGRKHVYKQLILTINSMTREEGGISLLNPVGTIPGKDSD